MILFLDFDGVLHRNVSRPPEDFSCSPRLWQILRTCPNVEVVFSTSWREIYPFAELVEFATLGGGEDLKQRFVGATPSLVREAGANIAGRLCKREDECRLWLAGNSQQNRLWLALGHCLEAAKREGQERSRELVQNGARTQESMFLISPEIVKTLKFLHRTDEF